MEGDHSDLAWRVGGPQGSGVDTAARLYAWACALGGLNVFGRREYYSNIMGRHSYYDIRASTALVTAHRDRIDLLVSFEPESLARHALSVGDAGAVVYNSADADVALERITFLDHRYRDDLVDHLAERGLPPTTAGLLQEAKGRGLLPVMVPFDELAAALAVEMDVPKSLADRTLNTMAVAVSTALVGFDRRHTYSAHERPVAEKEKVIALNKEAVNLVYDFVRREYERDAFDRQLAEVDDPPPRLFAAAAQVVAMGKLAGGLGMQTYYPISPATDESVYLEGHSSFPTAEGVDAAVTVVQTEDELSAITMACGAALTGARSATATSGPGFSLMTEALGWASTNEVPVVITLWQRGGPSTGMPTRTEQGDLLFAVHGGHGDFPHIVLASADLEEAFYDAAEAFNYADRFQMPVIHLLDKAMASTSQTLPVFDPQRVTIDRGAMWEAPATPGEEYERFRPTESGITPRAVLGQPGGTHWLTGAEHTPRGRVTEDPVIRETQMEKRMGKLELVAREIPSGDQVRVYGSDKEQPDLTLLSWGSTKGVIRETLAGLDDQEMKVRWVHPRLLWPFPAQRMTELLTGGGPVVVVELNYSGQLARLLREQTGIEVDHVVVKYDGRPMSAREVRGALVAVAAGGAPKRLVLRNPLE
ncbi:MAG: 2-oxoacid:acceptor oxidoreductase subunit alpha [Anaerolineae bacterium]